MTESESNIRITTYTTYLALTGELCGVYREGFGENWPLYNGTALYYEINMPCYILVHLSDGMINHSHTSKVFLSYHTINMTRLEVYNITYKL